MYIYNNMYICKDTDIYIFRYMNALINNRITLHNFSNNVLKTTPGFVLEEQ